MASSTSYLDVRSMAFSRFIMLLLLTIYEYYGCLCAVRFQSYASSCRIELVAQRQPPASFKFSRSDLSRVALVLKSWHNIC